MTTDPQRAAIELDVHECWERLRQAEVGRLAVLVAGRPDVFPVNFVVDHGTIVLRTAEGTKLTAALGPAGVAFECDGYEAAGEVAWSVVLKGRAEVLRSMQDLVDSAGLPLFPWHAAPKPLLLRVVPEDVTGRRFTVARASASRP